MQVQSTTQTTPSANPVRQSSENLSPPSDLKQTQRVNPREASADSKEVEGATQKLQDFVSSMRGDIQFSVDKDSGQTVVKVVDKNTQDVLMQLPSKEALEIAKALDKFQGLLVKQIA